MINNCFSIYCRFFPSCRYALNEQGNYICTIKLSNGKEIVGHGKSKKKAKQNAYQKAETMSTFTAGVLQ
jgi:hypothetical protein